MDMMTVNNMLIIVILLLIITPRIFYNIYK